jgi:hypothetical protein
VVVTWEQGTDLAFQPFDGPEEGFESQSEAEGWGFTFGEHWIADGKPAPNKYHLLCPGTPLNGYSQNL